MKKRGRPRLDESNFPRVSVIRGTYGFEARMHFTATKYVHVCYRKGSREEARQVAEALIVAGDPAATWKAVKEYRAKRDSLRDSVNSAISKTVQFIKQSDLLKLSEIHVTVKYNNGMQDTFTKKIEV